MSRHEQSERLARFAPPGYYQQWSRLAVFASDELRSDLLTAFENSTPDARSIITYAACEGPVRGDNIHGVGGWVTAEAEGFIRYLMAVAGTGALIMSAKNGEWDRKYLLCSLRHVYSTVGYGTPFDPDEDSPIAKARLVCYAANGPWEGGKDAYYLAEHFDALEPYLEFIVRSRDTSNGQLNMLLTTQPVPLAQGLL